MNKVYEENRIKAIADAIREKTGADTTYTTAQMPSGIDEVFKAGKQAEYDKFWDTFQNHGERTSYADAFRGNNFNFDNFYPKYDIKPEGNALRLLYAWEDTDMPNHTGSLAQRLKECGIVLDTSKATGLNDAFAYCYFSELPTIDFTGLTSSADTVFYASRMTKLEKIIVNENTKVNSNCFRLPNLEDVTFEGVIGQNGYNFQWSTKLSKSSIESVINALTDDTEHLSTISNPTVTLSKTAVENAFSKVDCLVGAVYAESQTKDGLTITNNGDGSFTLNGTYNGTDGYLWFVDVATVDLPFVANGTYILSLEGDSTNGIADIYTLGGLELIKGENTLITPNSNTTLITIVIQPGATFNNVTIRPKLVYDEWDSLICHISHFWTIALV